MVHAFEGLQRGMFSNANPSLIPDGYLSNCRNSDLNTYGMVVKAKGRTSSASGLTSGRNRRLAFFAPDGGAKTLLTFQNGDLWTWPNSGTWAQVTGATGLADEPVDIVQGDNKAFLIKQAEVIRYYDGTTVTAFTDTNTDPPRTKVGIYMLGWLLLANSAAANDGLYFGANGSPATGWNRTSNLLRIGKGEGGDITGLAQWTAQDLIVFKEQAIYAVTINSATPANWTITPITSDIGTPCGRTAVQFGSDFLFLAGDGIRSLLQSEQDKKRGAALAITEPIRDFIDTINWQYAKDVACAVEWKGQYYCSVPISPNQVNSHTIVYNPRNGSLDIRNYGFSDFSVGRFSSVPTLFSSYGATTGGVNTEESTFNDNGTAIAWTVETKRINGPNGQAWPHLWKRGGELEVFFESTGSYVVAVSAAVDGGSYTSLGNVTLTGTLPTLPIDLPFSLADQNITKAKFNLSRMGRFRDIQFKFTTSDAGAEVKLIRAVASLLPMAYTRDA